MMLPKLGHNDSQHKTKQFFWPDKFVFFGFEVQTILMTADTEVDFTADLVIILANDRK